MTQDPVGRWVGAGLITEEQGRAISSYEGAKAARPKAMISELFVYLGLAVLVASLIPVTRSLGAAGSGVLLATLAGAAGAAGAALLRSDGEALDRAGRVLWLFSVLFIAGAGAALSGTGSRGAARPLLFGGVPSLGFAAFYWRWERSGAQLVALYGSTILVVFGVANALADMTATSGGLLLAAVGALGLVLSSKGVVQPTPVAHQLFGVSLTLGFFISGTSGAVWPEVMGFLAAAFLGAWGVRERSPELLFTGALSLWVVTTHAVTRHMGGSGGAAWTVLILGAVLIAGAVRIANARFSGSR